MPLRMVFTAAERAKLGILVNNICIYATQLIGQGKPGFSTLALTNLANLQKEDAEFLKRLDGLAREHGDESPLRLIDDLARVPANMAQTLMLIRRCLAASAFIGHCIRQPDYPGFTSEMLSAEKRLH